jgi:hypothetical protein|tara:strand:+ start:339 stop:680 length:342 start_codon:yes stop_codon:yes gene_type:complete
MIFYFVEVQDTLGAWHLKTGHTSNSVKVRFKDKRNYGDGLKIIKTIEVNDDDIKAVENNFKEMQIGTKKAAQLGVPDNFMGRGEIIDPKYTKDEILDKINSINIPRKTTLEDF